MSTLQDAQKHVKVFFDANADSDDNITAEQHTELISTITDRDYSAKTVRARLRRKFTRSAELKNAAWRVSRTMSAQDLAYYMKRNTKAS